MSVSQSQALPIATPGWERIHFHFFPEEELGHLRTHWENLVIRSETPEFVEVPGGTVPKLSRPINNPCARIVCVYDREYRAVEQSARIHEPGRPGPPDLGPADLIGAHRDNRPAYFLGRHARHYGHFLLETLCRAWAWTEKDKDRVAVVASGPVRDFARGLCELIPGLADRIEVLDVSTQFDTVAVPAPAFVIGCQAHVEFKAMCERMAERAVPGPSRTTEQPVYLSRAGLYATAKRFLVGEERLEKFLEKEGFRIVRPELLPLAEQVKLFNSHKWIVAPIGSACHSRLFARNPINLIILCQHLVGHSNRPSDKSSFVLCDLLSDGTAHYASVFSTPDLGTSMAGASAFPLMLEEDRLLALLKGIGLVRPNAKLAGPPPDLAEYKRKWMDFARLQLEKRDNPKLSKALALLETGKDI